jgi:hypothetical protein
MPFMYNVVIVYISVIVREYRLLVSWFEFFSAFCLWKVTSRSVRNIFTRLGLVVFTGISDSSSFGERSRCLSPLGGKDFPFPCSRSDCPVTFVSIVGLPCNETFAIYIVLWISKILLSEGRLVASSLSLCLFLFVCSPDSPLTISCMSIKRLSSVLLADTEGVS